MISQFPSLSWFLLRKFTGQNIGRNGRVLFPTAAEDGTAGLCEELLRLHLGASIDISGVQALVLERSPGMAGIGFC